MSTVKKFASQAGLVEYGATPYAGDAYFSDWPKTLDAIAAFAPEKLVQMWQALEG